MYNNMLHVFITNAGWHQCLPFGPHFQKKSCHYNHSWAAWQQDWRSYYTCWLRGYTNGKSGCTWCDVPHNEIMGVKELKDLEGAIGIWLAKFFKACLQGGTQCPWTTKICQCPDNSNLCQRVVYILTLYIHDLQQCWYTCIVQFFSNLKSSNWSSFCFGLC
jgi:hypothetical protein